MTTLIDASQLIFFFNDESIYVNQIPNVSPLHDIVMKFLEEPKNSSEICQLGEDKRFIRTLLNYYRYGNICCQKKLHTDLNWLVFCKKFDIPPITFSSRQELSMWIAKIFDIEPYDIAYKASNFSLFVSEDMHGNKLIIIDILFEVYYNCKNLPPCHVKTALYGRNEGEEKEAKLIPYNDKIHHNIWKTPGFLSNSFNLDYMKWESFINFYIKNDYKYSNIYMSIYDILAHLSYYYDKNTIKVIKELNVDKASYLSYLPNDMINIIINNIGIYYPIEVGFDTLYATKYYISEMRIKNIISTSIIKRVKSNQKNYYAKVFVPIVSNYLKTHRACSIIAFTDSYYCIYPHEQISNRYSNLLVYTNDIRMRPLFIRSSKDIYDIEHVKINKIE